MQNIGATKCLDLFYVSYLRFSLFFHFFFFLSLTSLVPQAEPPVTEEAETAIPPQSSAPAQPKASHGPLLQAAHRDSVIVLCSGQRLFGQTPARGTSAAPAASTQGPSGSTQEPHGPGGPPVGAQPSGVCQPSGSEITAIHTKATLLCQKRGRDTGAKCLIYGAGQCFCWSVLVSLCILSFGLKDTFGYLHY